METAGHHFISVDAATLERAGIDPGDEVDVSVLDATALIVTRRKPACCVCGTTEGLLAAFGDDPVRSICVPCTAAITVGTLAFYPRP